MACAGAGGAAGGGGEGREVEGEGGREAGGGVVGIQGGVERLVILELAREGCLTKITKIMIIVKRY